LDDHGASLRGAYGDHVIKDDASVRDGCEDNEEPVVDQFHSDGTSENNLNETQFQESCFADYTTDQGEKSDDLSGEIDNRYLDAHDDAVTDPKYDVINSNSRLEGSSLSPEDHKVVPIVVFDGSGHETCSYVSSDLEDSQGRDGAIKAENGGVKFIRTRQEEDLKTRNSLEQNIADAEAGASQSVAHAFDSKSANQGSGEFDRVRTGNTKPAMQRRSSRGRRKKMPSLSSDSPPATFYPEEVAPVAATILTNPEIFADINENSTSNSDNVKSVQMTSKLQSPVPRLKAYYEKGIVRGKQKNTQIKGESLLLF
jgi:hypothetical protein